MGLCLGWGGGVSNAQALPTPLAPPMPATSTTCLPLSSLPPPAPALRPGPSSHHRRKGVRLLLQPAEAKTAPLPPIPPAFGPGSPGSPRDDAGCSAAHPQLPRPSRLLAGNWGNHPLPLRKEPGGKLLKNLSQGLSSKTPILLMLFLSAIFLPPSSHSFYQSPHLHPLTLP